MIAQWMLHVAFVTALLGLAATAFERVLRLWRREARMVWGAAMALSVIIPLLSLGQASGFIPALGTPEVGSPIGMLLAPTVIRASAVPWDLIISLCWVGATVTLTIRFVGSARGVWRRSRTWRPANVDGEAVLVSRDAGPAVVGFRKPTIVVPEWVLELDASLRALVLQHEREHRDRGDPRLLVCALAVVVAMPWNLAVWYCMVRLRSAMELDCDSRVLRAYPDTRRYGSLLLAVAQRADRVGLLTAALTESSSLLGRRILAMRSPIARRRLTLTLALAAFAATLTAVACEVQAPLAPAKAQPVVVPAGATYFEFQVEQPVTAAASSITPRYPDLLRKAGIEGEVLVQFVVRPDGRADVATLKILKQSHDLFGAAVKNALPTARFNPALVGGKAVSQLVQLPYTFSLSR
jgi:TonB family protein